MRIVNDLNFPPAYMKAIEGQDPNYKPDPQRIGVTALIDSPQIRQLTLKEWDNIVVPASDYFTGFLGQAMHSAFEKHIPDGCMAEKKWEVRVGDLTLVGKADLTNRGIGDYKLMSGWSWVFDKEKHFEEQLNILNWLRIKSGDKPAEFLRIFCFIKDWTEYQTRNKDYPQQRYFQTDLKIWPLEETDQFIQSRLTLHRQKDYQCNDEDKWCRVEKIAVMQKDRKNAVKLCDTYEEANKYILEYNLTKGVASGIIRLVQRKSECRRCLGYCGVRSVCPFALSLEKKNI